MKLLFSILIVMVTSVFSFSAEPDALAQARLEFSKVFPSLNEVRAKLDGELGHGINSIQVAALNGDTIRRGRYLYKGHEAAFFGNYFDEQTQARTSKQHRNVDIEEQAQKFNRFIAHVTTLDSGDPQTIIFVIKAFIQTLGFGEVIESEAALGIHRPLIDPKIAAEIKPLSFHSDDKGLCNVALFTFTPVRELTAWAFVLDKSGNILKAKRSVKQEWPIGN
jgi:hypothetical protein